MPSGCALVRRSHRLLPDLLHRNLLSGQIWHAINQAIPDLDTQIASGHFSTLLEWLRTNIHHHGSKYPPKELTLRATGEPLNSRYYVDYLQKKYGDIYGLG